MNIHFFNNINSSITLTINFYIFEEKYKERILPPDVNTPINYIITV